MAVNLTEAGRKFRFISRRMRVRYFLGDDLLRHIGLHTAYIIASLPRKAQATKLAIPKKAFRRLAV